MSRKPPPGAAGGLRAFAGGIGFIIGTPAVWGYALVPVAMVLLLSCGLGVLGVWGALRLAAVVGPEANGILSQFGLFLLKCVFVAAGLLLAFLLALGLAQPFSSFALFAIVDAQERALTGKTTPRPELADSMARTLWMTLLALVVCVPILALLFFTSLVFPPAAVVTVPLKFLLCAWLLAWNFLDYPLSLRQMGVTATLGWMGRHLGAVTAFGIAWTLLLVVPGVLFLFLPMGVAGATRLVVESDLDT